MKYDTFSVDYMIKVSYFCTTENAKEYFLTINSKEEATFTDELETLYDFYITAMEKCGLSEDTLVFGRFYISDIANQKDILRQSRIFDILRKGAVSVIQQCPVYNGSISLLVYHIKKNNYPLKREVFTYDNENRRNGAIIHGDNYDLLWVANFYGIGPFDSYKQTHEIFESFNKILNDNDMTLLDNAIRTWVYVRDVDNHYKGMVESRKAFFEQHGLNPDTRYIASTGIEGFAKEVNSLVSFDAFAINHLKKEQIVSMEALENLPPTIKYDVTFERGTRVIFGDRSHLHISGTASIDKYGKVIHISDVKKQTQRTIDNIKSLLSSHGAGLEDMAYYIVYIRDFKDKNKVMEVIEQEIPQEVPLLLLEGAVCRPAWLVEMEGLAIIPDSTEFPVFF